MTDGVSIDLSSALPYLEEKVRELLGKDTQRLAAQAALDRHLRVAVHDAGRVQIVGMDQPVSIFEIYQPTRLIRERDNKTAAFEELLAQDDDAVIYGGPGHGKTMLMRYIFASLIQTKNVLPILFTLRWPRAASDLATFVDAFADKKLKHGKTRVLLLIDGYDEVNQETRAVVAQALRRFGALRIGNFFLTCRTFYATDNLGATHWHIADFSSDDAWHFIKAFGDAYQSSLRPDVLIEELASRGFSDFLGHPLMLALVCILKSGPMPTLPRTTIGLIRRALDTLTFRWDEAKNIYRESRYSLDGDDRVRCLIRIAHAMTNLVEPDHVVASAAKEYLRLLQRSDVEPDRLLEELAQWYGLLVPTADRQWSFAHRTIHDYLAARYWVETIGFAPDKVDEWNARSAYAACLSGDATKSMVLALQRSSEIGAVVECLSNGAPFDVDRVAHAVVTHFVKFLGSGESVLSEGLLTIKTPKDLFAFASTDFLRALVEETFTGATSEHEVILWCSLAELRSRHEEIPEELRQLASRCVGDISQLEVRVGKRIFAGPVMSFLGQKSASS